MLATFTHLIGPQKGQRAKFDADRITIGRAPDNILSLGDGARRVSSHHAEVIQKGDQYLLRDLGSTNGTIINGRRVVVTELTHDDLIEFGAGGPLVRFGIERPQKEDQIKTTGKHREGDRLLSDPAVSAKTAGGVKNNAGLIAALAVAMILGGMGGIIASSRLRAADTETMSFAEIAELNLPAVVLIRTEFDLLDSSGQVTTTEARIGSGFIITTGGLIVTNRHLLFDWEYNAPPTGNTGRLRKIEAILPHHTLEEAVSAEVYEVARDKSLDVAVLRIDSPGAQAVHGVEPDIGHTNPGDEVVVIGYPLGLELLKRTGDTAADPSLSTGIVSRVGHDFIQLNLRAYHGNSGGPVLNRKGQVIGILTARLGNEQDIALCTPINSALELVKEDFSSAPKSARISSSQSSMKGIESWQINRNAYQNERPMKSFSRPGAFS